MPEGLEIDLFRKFVSSRRKEIDRRHGSESLKLIGLCTDNVSRELPGIRARLLEYAKTLKPQMLENKSHRDWAVRLWRLAQAIPDTHGLMIQRVWNLLPTVFSAQLSSNYEVWEHFFNALFQLRPDKVTLPEDTLQVSNLDRIEGFPVRSESVPEFTLEETREIIWEVAETGFRFELCALDRKASGKQRVSEVKDCFAGHMLVGIPLHFAKQGWAATALEERHRYIARTARLMLDWSSKSAQPKILQCVLERRPWSSANMQELETAVCRYYTQAFWEHFGRAAVLPMRLDHDLEKEEGEL
ncbi:hypothetical protein DFH09DRAFT_1106224 [Mycena vulgaris]|nr:hypothetical protein DFH09DRAFT_1106224 [Mycena vulgaris]